MQCKCCYVNSENWEVNICPECHYQICHECKIIYVENNACPECGADLDKGFEEDQKFEELKYKKLLNKLNETFTKLSILTNEDDILYKKNEMIYKCIMTTDLYIKKDLGII